MSLRGTRMQSHSVWRAHVGLLAGIKIKGCGLLGTSQISVSL